MLNTPSIILTQVILKSQSYLQWKYLSCYNGNYWSIKRLGVYERKAFRSLLLSCRIQKEAPSGEPDCPVKNMALTKQSMKKDL